MTLAPLYLWLLLLNLLCITPYTDGPRSFLCLLGSIIILWRLLPRHQLPASPGAIAISPPAGRLLAGLCLASCLVALGLMILGLTYRPDWLIDIGANTFAAVELFASGSNPYTGKAQLLVSDFSGHTPHVEIHDGQVTMFGMPYFHGYPYFPLMMLSYLPMYAIFKSYAAIRVTHVILMVLNLCAFKLLFDKLLPDRASRQQALLVAITAYLGVVRYAFEAVALGVTDLLISTWILYAFTALAHRRFLLAGLLLGCAQATKLLPAPFVLLGIVWMLYGQPGLRRFLLGYLAAATMVILPFLLWHPQGFISATILYYLTHHQGGDFTSLWFFLPRTIQPLFIATGIMLTFASIVMFSRRGKVDLASCMAGSYASYAIFMSFSKMTHLNYLWGVLPLGCIALAAALSGKRELT